MTAIRAIYDGKAFVPQEPVTLPQHCEVWVMVEQGDAVSSAQLDKEVRAYYAESAEIQKPDDEDEAWGRASGWKDQ